MHIIKVKKNQTLMDIALQEYGDIQGVFWLVEDNKLNGIISTVYEDTELLIRDEKINLKIQKYLDPYTLTTGEGAFGQGIGFDKIGHNFIVAEGLLGQGIEFDKIEINFKIG